MPSSAGGTSKSSYHSEVRTCASLMEQGRLGEARTLALQMAAYPPTRTPEASELGIYLFRLGEMAAAGRVLAAQANAGTATPLAQRMLSALLHKAGDLHAARQLLIGANTRDPFRGIPVNDAEKPILLRIAALHQSCYGMARNGTTGLFRLKLRRGHFSTKHFIDSSRYNVVVASLAGPNLPPAEVLPEPDIIVNSAACADLNPAGLEDVARFAQHFSGVPLINPPERVLATSRTGNASRLSAIEGVIFPQTINIRRPSNPEIALHMLRQTNIGYPIILRQAGSQTGRTMELARNEDEAERYIRSQPMHQPLVAIRFHDSRDTKGRYRKLRVFFIDGAMYPVVDLRSDHWNLHSSDRYRIMVDDAEAQKAELRFLEAPASVLGAVHMDRLAQISRTIGLDFFGIDFSPLPDGRLLVFEANAAMRHNYEHLQRFPYRKPFLDNISRAFERMLDERLNAS